MILKQKLHDTWFRFVGVPLVAVMSHIIFFNEQHGFSEEGYATWQIYLISIIETFILWEGNRLAIILFRNKYPGLWQSKKRITCQFITCMVVTFIIRYLNIWFYDKTMFWGYLFPLEGYLYNIFVGMLYVVIVGGVYEGVYYFKQWKQLFYETELLKRENLQTQLNSLKSQLNPHFLFNNLSSLVSLISEDQTRAISFVNELSTVYRYLLQASERNLTTLSAELRFIENYFHLLKSRFESGISLDYKIDNTYLKYYLPPLTLQIIIENAVKHNIILPERPLNILIYTDANENIVIVNNLQKKNSFILSNKVGLKNITRKYSLLSKRAVETKITEEEFIVTIPLIKTNKYETVDSGR